MDKQSLKVFDIMKPERDRERESERKRGRKRDGERERSKSTWVRQQEMR